MNGGTARSRARIARRRGKRGPNRVNSLQLSLFDAIIAIDGAMESIREQYPERAPMAVVICYRKLAERREQLRTANALIARLVAA